jgi:HNH endonuclease
MMLTWHKPQIETIFSYVPGEEIILPDKDIAGLAKHVSTFYEDLRRGKEGRRAPKTLVERPSVEELREVFEYNPETGELRWKISPSNNVQIGDVAGSRVKGLNTFYQLICVNNIHFRAHVLIWALHYGAWPEKDIDHKDHNGLNNKIENLRETTRSENQSNQRKTNTSSASTFKGVVWHTQVKKWCALIHLNYTHIHIGLFSNEHDAALSYDAAGKTRIR